MSEEIDLSDVEIDTEWMRVRRFRAEEYEKAGIHPFAAFRLALVPDLDWHKVVVAKKAGLDDDALIDLFID